MHLISRLALLPAAGLATALAACSVPCDRDIPMIIGRPAATPPATGQPGSWQISRRDQPLDRRVLLVGQAVPEAPPAPAGCLVPEDSVSLDSAVDTATAAVSHQLHVTDFITATGWRYWNTARLDGGETLVFHSLDRMVGECSDFSLKGCRHSETFTIDLPDPLIRSHAGQGLTVEADSATGASHSFTLTADQLKAQLAAIDALRRNEIDAWHRKGASPP